MKQEIHFENIENIIIENINNSKNYLFIAVAWLTNINIINSIIYASKKGVVVKLLINNDQINETIDYNIFIKNKIGLKFSNNLMHNKFCIIDGLKVLNGSYNWTKKANYNNENLSVIYDCKIIEKFHDEFNKLFTRGYNFKIDDRNYDDILKNLRIDNDFPYIIKMYEEKNTPEKFMDKPYILIRSYDDINNIISIIKDAYILKYNLNTWYSLMNYYTRYSCKNDNFFIFNTIVTPVEFKNDKIYLNDYNFLIIEKKHKSYIGGVVYKINNKGEFIDVIDYYSKNSKFDYYKLNTQNGKKSILCNKDLFNLEKLENFRYEYIETIENQELLICKSDNLFGLLNYNFDIIVDFVNSDYFLEDDNCKFIETNALRIYEDTFFFKKYSYLIPQIRRIESSNNQKNADYWGSRFETIYNFQDNEIIKLKRHNIAEYFFFSYCNYKYKNLYIQLIGKKIEHNKFHEILKFYETNKDINQIIKNFDL